MKSSRAFAAASFVALLLPASAARAEKDACITAYEETQTRRKDGKLLDAKREAAICARTECPAMLVKDCVRWLAELEGSIPSVVLDVRRPSGEELTDVHVSVDGVPIADRLDGKAIPLDPGRRAFRFEAEGATPVERVVVVREGEKHRKISVVLHGDASSPDGARGARPIPKGVWIFGGASAVALATSAVFAIDGFAKKGDLEDCKPRCAPSDVDAMSASFTVADVMLGAGLMAGAAAVWLYLTRPSVDRGGSGRAQPWIAPIGTAGGAAGFGATF